jgi:hypothetical protein
VPIVPLSAVRLLHSIKDYNWTLCALVSPASSCLARDVVKCQVQTYDHWYEYECM